MLRLCCRPRARHTFGAPDTHTSQQHRWHCLAFSLFAAGPTSSQVGPHKTHLLCDTLRQQCFAFHHTRLYRLIQSLEAHLPCALAGDAEWSAPAGWELVSMLNITEPGDQEAPFAAIILNEEASQLVVALRGTMLPGEWALDFSYK